MCLSRVSRAMWDWYLVGELTLGIEAGVLLGGLAAAHILRTLAYEILSHPTTRRLAAAAEKLSKAGDGGGLGGLLMSFLGGGRGGGGSA